MIIENIRYAIYKKSSMQKWQIGAHGYTSSVMEAMNTHMQWHSSNYRC